MKKIIDNFLNGITMYKLVLYILIIWIAIAAVFSFFGLLSFSPISLLAGTFLILIIGMGTNLVFAQFFGATVNFESVYISVLILALIITPPRNIHDIPFIFWATVWTMAGKYIFAYRNKHIFNPVALGVFITSVFLQQSASWWIGTSAMLIPVAVGGYLITRKIRRESMVTVFILTASIVIAVLTYLGGSDMSTIMRKIFMDTAIIFFATVMFTEPLTTPPTKNMRIYYAALVGLLFPPQIHLGSIYSTPELALLIGNVFSYAVSFKERLGLKLKEKLQLAPEIYDFIFTPERKINFLPGQYLEWTLPQDHADSRGNRRYFTLASSPTETDLRIGVKFYGNSSSFKNKLLNLNPGENISAASLSGDFTLPKNKTKKLVFIAGGIGVTPYRSMIKYLLDTGENRDIVLIYSVKDQSEFVYRELFNEASQKINLKTVYIVSEASADWNGKTGRITPELLGAEVPDLKERTFYISGPQPMVDAYKDLLKGMKISNGQIVTDYFPGLV